MCKIASTCPRFEHRNKNGVNNICKNCEYLKRERRQLFILRTLLVVSFLTFLITTYFRFE